MRTITLKYESVCRDCGAKLKAGARARYYGPGRVYGLDCHTRAKAPTVRQIDTNTIPPQPISRKHVQKLADWIAAPGSDCLDYLIKS